MPTPKQLEVIVQKMDQVHTIDLGILVHKSEIQVGTKIEEELRSGVTRFGVPADLPVSAMLVRPLYDWHPRSIAVFGL